MSKIFICGRKFEYDGLFFRSAPMSIIFTKLSPRKSSVFAVFLSQEALTGIFPARFQHKKCRVRTPPHPREGLPRCPEQRFPSLFDCRFRSKTRPFACRKALLRAQRGRRHHATAAPLQCNKALTADQRGPYGKVIAARRRDNGKATILKWLRINRLENQRI